MAEALISVLLEKLASIVHQQVPLEVNLVGNVKKEVAKLTPSFRTIEAVLKDAEQRQVEEVGVRDWLDRLKDVSYDVEDVLDEWSTLQIEKEGGNAPVATTKTVSQCIPAPFFCSGQVSRVIFPHDIPGKIQELNVRLALIVTERQNYNFQCCTKSGGIEKIERPNSTSFVDKTFGRVDEKQLLVSKLLSESGQEGKTPYVIPIIGMGGIGKTTLAQLAYNDERVKANFTKRIRVCVSDPFDEINIARAIVENLNKNDVPNSNNLQALLECVDKNIKDQKFLLILDDVWNDNYTKWEPIKVSLQNGAIGSRILVTTRNEKVAMMMATSNNIIHLEVLSEENCWSIFFSMALADRERDELRVLEPFRKEIAKKCRGLPLVAKALGGHLRGKKTKKEWQVVLNSKIWELDIFQNYIFKLLFLSYLDLASTIKPCLLYCVIFPKDHQIRKDFLIELWISQGYISSNANNESTMMDDGESYFNHLVMRSFFQDFEKDEIGNNFKCWKMHDIVHDFLQFLTKNECFIIGAKGGLEKIELPAGNKFRHLTLMFAGEGPFLVSFDNCKSLRTFTTFDCKITSLGNPKLILQLKYLRTLNLSRNQLKEVPKEVGGLVHLRYLDLSKNEMLKKLPDTLCKLVNLQTLRVDECNELEELPEEMGKLTNLRHLHVEVCWHLKLPKTIKRLKSLQTLDWVNIWGHDDVNDNNKHVFKLSDLTDMNQLQRRLVINWRKNWKDAASDADKAAASDAAKAKLVDKEHLLSLELQFWYWGGGARRSMMQEEILSALQPNSNLESLLIRGYSGTTLCPNWMKNMNNLTSLEFDQCGVCEFAPLSVFGNLRSLETLTFAFMYKVKKVEFENSTSSSSLKQDLFPNLKQLKFSNMLEWSDVDQESDCVAMPCLSTLSIHGCSKLKALPHFLQKMHPQQLTINYCKILSQSCKNRQGKEWPNISHIPNIQIDGKTVQKDGVWIQEEEEEEDWIEGEEDEETHE